MDRYWLPVHSGPRDGTLFYDGRDPSEDWHLVIVGERWQGGDYYSNGRRVEWVAS
jgi:hypothetical protein